MPAPNYFDSHMHTPLCKHAFGHPRAYARQGMERGLKGVIFTCHAPMPDGFSAGVRMDPDQFDFYVRLIKGTAEEFKDEFVVRLGLESEYFPGMEPWVEDLHRRADFHYVLGSVHYHIAEYYHAYFHGDLFRFQEQYFAHIAESAETGLYDALSHPDLVKNAAPEEWDFKRIRPAIESALDRIAVTGVAMELNTSGLNKSYPEMNPGGEMLRLMAARNIPVVLGSDSHTPERVGADFGFALRTLSEAGYEKIGYFEERQRRDLAISDVLETLKHTAMSSQLENNAL